MGRRDASLFGGREMKLALNLTLIAYLLLLWKGGWKCFPVTATLLCIMPAQARSVFGTLWWRVVWRDLFTQLLSFRFCTTAGLEWNEKATYDK